MTRILIIACVAVAAIASVAAIYTAWQATKIADHFPPAGSLVQTEGLRLHLTDERPNGPEKATLVLIHGASGNEREMRAALGKHLLAGNYRVISIDRPGHGWSQRPAKPGMSDPAAQARLIHQALQQHGVTQAVFVVHSLAGALGLQLALDHTSMAKGIVLISPVTHPWPGGIALYYSVSASQIGGLFNYTLALPAGQALMNTAVASVFSPQIAPPSYLEQTGVELVLRPPNFAANAEDVAGLYNFVARQANRYNQIKIPVAIVSGEADRIVLTHIHSKLSAQAIPGATLNILPGVGHVPHWTHPQAVVSAIDVVHSRLQPTTGQAAR